MRCDKCDIHQNMQADIFSSWMKTLLMSNFPSIKHHNVDKVALIPTPLGPAHPHHVRQRGGGGAGGGARARHQGQGGSHVRHRRHAALVSAAQTRDTWLTRAQVHVLRAGAAALPHHVRLHRLHPLHPVSAALHQVTSRPCDLMTSPPYDLTTS